MSVLRVLVWGFAATVVLTTLMSASQGAGITRMNLPFMLGTIFTPDRDKAKLYGFVFHLVNGWIFAFIYALLFHFLTGPSVWLGAILGFFHAAFVLTAGMSLLPSAHPRMASPARGPTITRRLEPPGFLALHYGYQTPLSVVASHLVFGIILGAFL